MSVSFTLLKANGQRFDPLPGHDDREFSLSNANAADILDALGLEHSFSERPWPPDASASATLPPPSPSPKPGSRGQCS